jgi:hypothetical protein
MLRKFMPILSLVFALFFSSAILRAAPTEAAMPKKGEVAVIAVPMNYESSEYVDIIENAIIEKLISSGYKVVDSAKKQQIRAAAAKRKADQAYLNGDVDALMKISFSYNVGTVVTVKFRVDRPVENEFKLQTGTASVTFNAKTSGGDYTYASPGPVLAKQVGYSPDEARTKAIASAGAAAAEKLVM